MEIQTGGDVLRGLLGGYDIKKGLLQKSDSDKNSPSVVEKSVKDSSIKGLLDSLMKDLANDKISKEEVLKLLQNSILQKSSKSIAQDINSLLSLINSKKSYSKIDSLLNKLLLDIAKLDGESFKSGLEKSGLFLESKIANIDKPKNLMPYELKKVIESIKGLDIADELKERLDTLLKSQKADRNFFDTLKEISASLKRDASNSLLNVAKLEEALPSIEVENGKIQNFKPIVKDGTILRLAENILKEANQTKEIKREFLNLLSQDKGLKKDSKILQKVDLLLNKNVSKEVFTRGVESLAKEVLSDDKTNLLNSKEAISNLSKELKGVISEISKEEFSKDVSQNIKDLGLILRKVENLSARDISSLDIPTKLKRVVNLLKQELDISQNSTNAKMYELSKKGVELESVTKELLSSKKIFANQELSAAKDPKSELLNDIKSELLRIKDTALKQELSISHKENISIQADKVLSKIEYFQLLSYTGDSNVSYLPLLWDGLEEGSVSIKKLKQKRFFCDIKLKLKRFGDIEVMVMLHDNRYINISVFSKNSEFLKLSNENKGELKRGISSVGLICENIYFYDTLRDEKIKEGTIAYVNSNQTGKGIDLQI